MLRLSYSIQKAGTCARGAALMLLQTHSTLNACAGLCTGAYVGALTDRWPALGYIFGLAGNQRQVALGRGRRRGSCTGCRTWALARWTDLAACMA